MRVMVGLELGCGKLPWVFFRSVLKLDLLDLSMNNSKEVEILSFSIRVCAEQNCILQQRYQSELSGL